jgi:hypothetical protein
MRTKIVGEIVRDITEMSAYRTSREAFLEAIAVLRRRQLT